MKKQLLFTCGLLIFLAGATKAQLSGVYSVPGSYTSVAAAINDLNTQGVNEQLLLILQPVMPKQLQLVVLL
ncbi:MAG: hypothetical protein IPJ60_14805 [Sphingobacteriaceae bacterium]|nr:hypothetical protein [Sphingobacteriaceae bacterium]